MRAKLHPKQMFHEEIIKIYVAEIYIVDAD